MMVNNPQQTLPSSGKHMIVQEYFRLDYAYPDAKYEYQDNMIRLMAGGSREHDDIAFNMRTALKQQFQSGPCSIQGSDMRIQVAEDTYFYPDVTLTCDVADRRRGNKVLRSPRIVVEVLSPSTERIDRADRLKAHQGHSTIQEIVLIDQFRPYVEIYRRNEEDNTEWSHIVYESGEEVALASVDVFIPMEDIYQGIDFDEPLLDE